MRRPRAKENQKFYVAVGQKIATHRGKRITQEALALKARLTRTSIINIEKGRQQILLHTLVDIATALSVSPIELIPETDNIDTLLRDKPKEGVEWVKASASNTKR